jgi:hypothetical protein
MENSLFLSPIENLSHRFTTGMMYLPNSIEISRIMFLKTACFIEEPD